MFPVVLQPPAPLLLFWLGKGGIWREPSQVPAWMVLKIEEVGRQQWWNWRKKWTVTCSCLWLLSSNQKEDHQIALPPLPPLHHPWFGQEKLGRSAPMMLPDHPALKMGKEGGSTACVPESEKGGRTWAPNQALCVFSARPACRYWKPSTHMLSTHVSKNFNSAGQWQPVICLSCWYCDALVDLILSAVPGLLLPFYY